GMAMLGLIGGPLIIISGTAVLFNVIEPGSAAQFITTIPEIFWELSLGISLMVKGFKPSPILSGTIGDAGADERPPALAASDRYSPPRPRTVRSPASAELRRNIRRRRRAAFLPPVPWPGSTYIPHGNDSRTELRLTIARQ